MREIKLTVLMEVDGRPQFGFDPFIRRLMVDEITGLVVSELSPGSPSNLPVSDLITDPRFILVHANGSPVTLYPNSTDVTPLVVNPGGLLLLFDVTLLNGGPRLSNESENAIPVDTFLGGS